MVKVAQKKEIQPDEYFKLRNGSYLKDLEELYGALSSMDEESFNHHVNQERNDFFNWINGVFNDSKLARQVLEAKTPADMAQCVKKRLIVQTIDSNVRKQQAKKRVQRAVQKPTSPQKLEIKARPISQVPFPHKLMVAKIAEVYKNV